MRDAARAAEIRVTRENARYLPGVEIDGRLDIAGLESAAVLRDASPATGMLRSGSWSSIVPSRDARDSNRRTRA